MSPRRVLQEGKALPKAFAVIDEVHAFLKEPAQISANKLISTPYEFVKNTFKIMC